MMMSSDSKQVAAFLAARPGRGFSDARIAREALSWVNRSSDNRGFNKRAARVAREVKVILPGVVRQKGCDNKTFWRYDPVKR
jgi:hypothetical protein